MANHYFHGAYDHAVQCASCSRSATGSSFAHQQLVYEGICPERAY